MFFEWIARKLIDRFPKLERLSGWQGWLLVALSFHSQDECGDQVVGMFGNFYFVRRREQLCPCCLEANGAAVSR